MFGTFRTLLAMMVILSHLGGVPVIGAYAVFGFYILSGYLMTLIMQERYGYSTTGFKKYFINRFLRIYPLYWLACIVSLALIAFFGSSATTQYHDSIFVPSDMESVLRNIFIVLSDTINPRLTPPAWALTVELFFYIAIGLGLSRTKSVTWLWFSVSVLYTCAVILLHLPLAYRYSIIPAASLPFSTGAIIYHHKDTLKNLNKIESVPFFILAGIILNWTIGFTRGTLFSYSFYLNYLLCGLMIISLSTKKSLLLITNTYDKLLGDFSYPIYLFHWQIGLLTIAASRYLGFSVLRPSIMLVCLSLPIIFFFSWILAILVEFPIEQLRSRNKESDKKNKLSLLVG